MIQLIKKILRSMGCDIVRYQPSAQPRDHRKQLYQQHAVNVVLDVGANTGQYAAELRRNMGYTGKLVSFEPVRASFDKLEQDAEHDAQWQTRHCALGDEDGEAEINVAGNSVSSSIRDMLPNHMEAAPESEFVGKENIQVKKLDTVFDEFCQAGDVVYLKIDTQGFEKQVIDGAKESLPKIKLLEVEMSLSPLYDGELPMHEMHEFLHGLGYSLVSLEPGFTDPKTGKMMQVDGIFQRN